MYSCILHPVTAQQYGWKNITAKLPDFPYDTIWSSQNEAIVCGLRGPSFISDNEGWIVSANANDAGGSAVLHTMDGGETWEFTMVNSVCTDIHMVDGNTGYAGGYGGQVWRTTDGGATWKYHGTTAVTISDIEFPPAPTDTGYVSGMDGHVAWITPAGITPLVAGIVGHVETMSFPVTWQEGWFEGEGWGMIRHFVNGQWIPDQIHISGYFNAIDFVDNQYGWAAGDRIIHTTDGHTWTEQANHPVLPGDLFSVFFLNRNEGWAAGSVGQILKTTNGGELWVKEELGTDAFFTGIQFTSPTNGYLVGNNKAIYKYMPVSGLEENRTEPTFEICPNPVFSNFTVHIPDSGLQTSDLKLEIVDIFGKKVAGYDHPVDMTFDISQLPAGIYFCRINVGNRLYINKIIKV